MSYRKLRRIIIDANGIENFGLKLRNVADKSAKDEQYSIYFEIVVPAGDKLYTI